MSRTQSKSALESCESAYNSDQTTRRHTLGRDDVISETVHSGFTVVAYSGPAHVN